MASSQETAILGPGGVRRVHPGNHNDLHLAPNYVFNCAYGTQCNVNWLTPAALRSCSARPATCLDSLNRGLLSGLQAPIRGDESVFDEELQFIKARRELEQKILQGGTDIYDGMF